MSVAPDASGDVQAWRKATRKALIEGRVAAGDAARHAWNRGIEAHLERLLPTIACEIVGFCWPYKDEPDARPVVQRLMDRGARAALPVVVAPRTPLAFREWRPGCAMQEGAHGIPEPGPDAAEVTPDLVLLPMNGFDAAGYRLGYGSGFFDRTLASLDRRPTVIGLCYELGRLDTIRPQPHDIPLDFVVTEAGAWRRGAAGLAPVRSGAREDDDRRDR